MQVGDVDERFDNQTMESDRFEDAGPIAARPRRVNRGLRLAIASSALASSVLVLALAFFLALKPTSARAVWAQFARIIDLKKVNLKSGELKSGPVAAANGTLTSHWSESLADLGPQQQAELLLEAGVNNFDGSTEQLLSRLEGWRGQLTMSPQLTASLVRALNSNDMRVRAAAVEMELVAYNLPETHDSAEALIERIETDPAGRPWALWMLGAIGNRGIGPERALQTLVAYSHDSDENTRFWAVEGLSLLGSDATIQPLLEIFRNDPSIQVRERAGSGLARSGMLTKEQRFAAVPKLMEYGEDPSLDSNTRNWVYQALRDITGARYGTNPTDWREWWAENRSR
jgi:hypothetical protein